MSADLSQRQARWIALEAQGFGRRHRPRGEVSAAHLRRTAERLGVVQIDSVNVVTRSHYLPFFSRLGVYDPARLDRLRDRGPRRLVEYWAHEASLVPVEVWPLLGFRMRRAHDEAWGGMRRVAAEHPELVRAVEAAVAAHGPATARELEAVLEHTRDVSREHWGWNWSLVKAACEHLFWAGRITSAGRTRAFERRYATPESVLPPEVAQAGPCGRPIDEDEAFTRLVALSARAVGVGTEQCLRDYVRLSPAQVRPALARLVEAGELIPVSVQGWRRPAYLHRDARIPARRPEVAALVSPFDSLIWQRDRTRALFDFDYRLEIYVPAPARIHGYYVLPFVLDDSLVARLDLKADRQREILVVRACHWEEGARRGDAPDRLRGALGELAEFLGLGTVEEDRACGAVRRGTLET